MTWIFYLLFSFFCGSLPLSVWIGRAFLHKDIRQAGDGNPGATNVFRSGNSLLGVLALMLDISKAAAPVGFAYNALGYRGLPMLLIALAPIFGHAFSPFLRFHGGKALATALGVWIGLTAWKASSAAVFFTLIGFSLFQSSGWAVVFGLSGILVVLLCWIPEPLLLEVWVLQAILLGWTHHAELLQKPRLRPWVSALFRRSKK